VLAGVLGITYVDAPHKVVKALSLNYYEEQSAHE